jgi:hypothetical protein
MESDSDSDSSSEAPPRQILIEDAATRQAWVPVTDAERALIERAMAALKALPEPDVGADVQFKPDKLAISKLPGPGAQWRQMVYRIHYLGNTEIWLRDDGSTQPARRIVVFPEHEGARPPPVPLPLDTRQQRTLETLPDDILAAADLDSLATQAGVIWAQDYEPNAWTELDGEARTAVLHALVASRAEPVNYTGKTQHLVTLKKSKGTAAYQVFRDRRYGLWLADVDKGHGKPRSYRRVVVGGWHHPVPEGKG